MADNIKRYFHDQTYVAPFSRSRAGAVSIQPLNISPAVNRLESLTRSSAYMDVSLAKGKAREATALAKEDARKAKELARIQANLANSMFVNKGVTSITREFIEEFNNRVSNYNAGTAAVSFTEDLMASYNEAATKILNTAPSEEARVNLEGKFGSFGNNLYKNALNFETQSQAEYYVNDLNETINTLVNQVISDPGLYRLNGKIIEDAIFATSNILDDKQVNQLSAESMSKLGAAYITGLINNKQYDLANEELNSDLLNKSLTPLQKASFLTKIGNARKTTNHLETSKLRTVKKNMLYDVLTTGNSLTQVTEVHDQIRALNPNPDKAAALISEFDHELKQNLHTYSLVKENELNSIGTIFNSFRLEYAPNETNDPIVGHHLDNLRNEKYVRKDGKIQTVYTAQVNEEGLNDGRPTLIPLIWDGKELSQEDAVKEAIKSGIEWPSADTHDQLREYDKLLHERFDQDLRVMSNQALDRETVHKALSLALQNHQRFLKDPVQYLLQTSDELITLANNVVDGDPDSRGIFNQQLVDMQIRMGIAAEDIQLYTKAQAKEVVDRLQNLDAAELTTYAAELEKNMGGTVTSGDREFDTQTLIFSQLKENGLRDDRIFALSYSNLPAWDILVNILGKNETQLLELAKISTDRSFLTSEEVTSTILANDDVKVFIGALSAADPTGGNTGLASQYMDMLLKTTYSLLISSPKSSTAIKDAIGKAVGMLIEDKYWMFGEAGDKNFRIALPNTDISEYALANNLNKIWNFTQASGDIISPTIDRVTVAPLESSNEGLTQEQKIAKTKQSIKDGNLRFVAGPDWKSIDVYHILNDGSTVPVEYFTDTATIIPVRLSYPLDKLGNIGFGEEGKTTREIEDTRRRAKVWDLISEDQSIMRNVQEFLFGK